MYSPPRRSRNPVQRGAPRRPLQLSPTLCDGSSSRETALAVLAKGHWEPDRRRRHNEHRLVPPSRKGRFSPLSSLRGHRLELSPGARSAATRSRDAAPGRPTLGEPTSSPTAMASNPMHCWCVASRSTRQRPWRHVPAHDGIDVQDDLGPLVVGWGPGEEVVDSDRDTLAEPWTALERSARSAGQPAASGVAARFMRRALREQDDDGLQLGTEGGTHVYAIMGRAPSCVRRRRRDGGVASKVPLYTVGVDAAKAAVGVAVEHHQRAAGTCVLPLADWCHEDSAAQLTVNAC